MKLNGALKPHHGAPPPPPVIGSFFGVKKYRDKKRECSSAAPQTTTKQQQQPTQQQHQQKLEVVEVENIEKEQEEEEKRGTVCNIKTITTRRYNNNNQWENVNEKENKQIVASFNKISNKNTSTITVRTAEAAATTNINCNDKNNNNDNNSNSRNTKINEILCISKESNIVVADADKPFHDYNYKMPTKMVNDTDVGTDAADCRHQRPSLIASSLLSSSLPLQYRLRYATAIISQSTSLPPSMLNESIDSSRSGVIVNVAAEFMCRAQQSLKQQLLHFFNTAITTSSRATKLAAILCLLYATVLLPTVVRCDENDNFFAVNGFSMGPETTTPEFDYASRGQKKFGDKCDNTLECGFPGSICDPKKKSCQCTEDLPVTNHIDKCGKEAAVNESCFFNEQCEVKYFQTECRDGRCVCRFEMSPIWGKDGTVECKGRQDKRGPETYIDPAMIGVLVGMALMFIIICVVLRLFSQARWRENRTIFNTPNPRLMNVSLLRDSKLLHGQERRGSRMSVRAPSRQPSMASLRPHSPNPSLGKTGSHSNSASGSNASATSVRSTRSNSVAPGHVVVANNSGHHERKGSQHHTQQQHQQHLHHQQQQQQHQQQQQQPLITNITSNPAAESVTVEIVEPEK